MTGLRRGTGLSEYICSECGHKELRRGWFMSVPEIERTYKGQEVRQPEYCTAVYQRTIVHDNDPASVVCHGLMIWTPTQAQTDLLGENFVVDVGDGPQKLSSLSEVRNLERASLRRAANGEGAPLNFRALSMDRSNRDQNSLKGSTYERSRQVPINPTTQSGQPISVRAKREHD